MQETISFTPQIAYVYGLIFVLVVLFIKEWVRVDIAALIVVAAIALAGIITPEQVFSGLSSNAVISIGAIMVIGTGLDKTGIMSRVVSPIVRLTKARPNRLVLYLSSLVALMSSFIQNIGAAALVLPAVQRISRDEGIPISRLLMPIGFSAILGGTLTLIGSSPLILLNDLIDPFDMEDFSLFSVTPVGITLVVAGFLYFVIFGRWVFKSEDGDYRSVSCMAYTSPGEHYELVVPDQLPETLSSHTLRAHYNAKMIGVSKAHGGGVDLAPDERLMLYPGDTIAVVADEEALAALERDFGLRPKQDLDLFAHGLSMNDWGLVEAVVGPNSHIEGKTLGEINFRDRYRLNILSLVRGSQMFDADLDESRLKIGDTLLLAGPWENFRRLGAEQPFMFIFCDKIREKQVAPIKAFWAGLWFLVALILILGFRLHLSVGLLTGALGMVLTRVLTIDEAYRSVDWRTIFLLAGLIPLGLASMETGAAAFVVQKAMPLLTQIPTLVAFVGLGAITTLFTLLVSNVGAVILLTPLAVSMADQIGADPRTAALLVALATSNSFMLPTHQVNALYMGAGRYHTVDFIRAGSIMSVIFLGVLILALHLFYGLS